jgi:predicted esterase
VLVGPDARRREAWQLRADGPDFIRALIADVAAKRAIDRNRIYLFGSSGGAVYSLTLSMVESELFAATAVHAGAWRAANEFRAVPYARRKIPIAIFIGDRDEFFPLFAVRKTQKALEQAGHRVNVTVIPGHRHDYSEVAAEVNRSAWEFLKGNRL